MKLNNSPTFTDSTDEPTPMGLFSKHKGFKFSSQMIDEMMLEENNKHNHHVEGIEFEDNQKNG